MRLCIEKFVGTQLKKKVNKIIKSINYILKIHNFTENMHKVCWRFVNPMITCLETVNSLIDPKYVISIQIKKLSFFSEFRKFFF